MHSSSAIQLPEVLHLIACHLDVHSRLNCRQVCRLWSALFSPYVVKSIDGANWPWLSKWSKGEPERERGKCAVRTAFIQEYKDHIRHLTLRNNWLLEVALQFEVTRLTSLTMAFDRETSIDSAWSFDGLLELGHILHVTNWYYAPGEKSDLTRACWQLILNNPELQSLRFTNNANHSLYELAGKRLNNHPVYTPEAISFLLDTLAGLPKLRHLMIANGMDDWLLHVLPKHLPHITSVEYEVRLPNGLDSLPPGHCATLRHLTIHSFAPLRQVRTVLAAFPALQTLSLRMFAYFDSHQAITFTDEEIITHPLLELSLAQPAPILLRLGVRFTHLKSIRKVKKFKDHGVLLSLLSVLPALEQLDVLEILESPQSENESSLDYRDDRDIDDHPLRSLNIKQHALHPLRMTRLFSRLPHLVKLEVRYIPPAAVVAIARTCKSIEQLRFSVKQRCNKEINQLLVGCPKLKSLRGQGLAINIDDLLQGPSWTCFDIESLQCGIMGVPRLSKEEEDLLKTMKKGSHQEPVKDEEQKILEKQRESWAVQGHVLQHLACFKDLKHLDIGFLKLPHRQGHRRYEQSVYSRYQRISNAPVPDSLELSMASGLAHLASLHRLETFGFGEVDHRIGESELRWMGEHWSLERVFGFGGCDDDGEQYDNDILELCNQVKEIMPAVDVLQGRHARNF